MGKSVRVNGLPKWVTCFTRANCRMLVNQTHKVISLMVKYRSYTPQIKGSIPLLPNAALPAYPGYLQFNWIKTPQYEFGNVGSNPSKYSKGKLTKFCAEWTPRAHVCGRGVARFPLAFAACYLGQLAPGQPVKRIDQPTKSGQLNAGEPAIWGFNWGCILIGKISVLHVDVISSTLIISNFHYPTRVGVGSLWEPI